MLRVAIDVGRPTAGAQESAMPCAWTVDALAERDDLELRRYVTSARSAPQNQRRVPMPAAAALRDSGPTGRHRWIGGSIVRTWSTAPTTWFHGALRSRRIGVRLLVPRAPGGCRAQCLAPRCCVLRRAVADGAHVVTSPDATIVASGNCSATERVRTVLLGAPPATRRTCGRGSRQACPSWRSSILTLGTIERRRYSPRCVDAFGRLRPRRAGVRT